jgi:hypothetical protein
MGAAVQPPQVTQLATVLPHPFAVKFCIVPIAAGTNVNGCIAQADVSNLWAFVTLVDENGRAVRDCLTGTLSVSAQALGDGILSNGRTRGYFLFDNLVIHAAGYYRLQVTIVQMDSDGSGTPGGSGATGLGSFESRIVAVDDRPVRRQSPGESSIFLP